MDDGRNTLISKSELISEWDFEANTKLGLEPNELLIGSSKKAWWICKKCGHKWQTQINVRKKGHGCPRCGHLKVGACNANLKDPKRSLLVVFPDAVKVWNYKKNKGLKPEDFAAGSNKKVWWKCSECGKEWQTTIYAKAKSGTTTCKSCSLRNNDRRFLKVGVNDLSTVNPTVAAEWNYERNGNLTPNDVTANSSVTAWWKCKNGHEWETRILNRTHEGYRGCPICANKRVTKDNCLQTVNPELAKEWNYEKNGDLTPNDIVAGSNKKVWWKCNKGHEWETSPNNRNRTNCPYCANLKVWPGFNDLASQYPDVAKMWNYEKNYTLLPTDVVCGSGKKVWWKCDKNHEWKAPVVAVVKGHGCPVCKNRRVISGVNDLKTTNPELASEWNYEKNGDLTPDQIIAGSPKTVWWKCKNGHEWQASIVSRNKGHYCPICDTNKHTSLAEKTFVFYLRQSGVIVEENKRIGRKELDIYLPKYNTGIEYDGEHYHTDPKKDQSKNDYCKENGIQLIRIREPKLPDLNGCKCIKIHKLTNDLDYLILPIQELFSLLNIKSKVVINPKEDLQAIHQLFQLGERKESIAKTHPNLAAEWDYKKNTLSPEMVSQGQHYKAWWICKKCGYRWEAQVYSRCAGAGCPNCAGVIDRKKPEKLIVGINDLKTVRPDLAKEWDYATNKTKPDQYTSGSNEKVNWICKHNHIYTASIANRVKGTGCPYCSNRKVLTGFNDLATLKPEIAKEWDYEKNEGITPDKILAGTIKKVWWKCDKCGRKWQTKVCLRKKTYCPICNRKGPQGEKISRNNSIIL